MKNILILGGAGLFAHKLVQSLSEAGHKTIVFDNLLTGKNEHIKWGPLIKASITDTHRIEKAIHEYKLDLIINTVTDFNSEESSFARRKIEIENFLSCMTALKKQPQVKLLWIAYENSTSLEHISLVAEEFRQNFDLKIELKVLSNFTPNFSFADFA